MAGSVEVADGQLRRNMVRSLHKQYAEGGSIDVYDLTPDETYRALFGETVQFPGLHLLGQALRNATEHIFHPRLPLRHTS